MKRRSKKDGVRTGKRARELELFSFAEQARSYDASSTSTMENDQQRMQFYSAALRDSVEGKVVMDIGTGDNGILAQLALQAGAKHAHAVEIREGAAKSAQATLERLYPGKATVFCGNVAKLHRRDTALLAALRETEVFVHEIFGTIASEEGIAQIFRALRSARSTDTVLQSVPQRAETLISPVTRPKKIARAVTTADQSLWQGYAESAPEAQLAPPQAAEALEFESVDDALCPQRPLIFRAGRAGLWDALHLQLKLVSHRHELVSEGATTNWEDIFVTVPRTVLLRKGEQVRLLFQTICHDDACEYKISIESPKRAAGVLQFNSADLHSIQLG